MRGSVCNAAVLLFDKHFNSRLYMRGSTFARSTFTPSAVFQFTPLHERQQVMAASMELAREFQFTPLHERQHLPFSSSNNFLAFQFTPLHERQLFADAPFLPVRYFNSRLYMRGSTDTGVGCSHNASISIHAST